MINLKKPLRTRSRQPVRVLATDVAGERPIAIAIMQNGVESVHTVYPNGRYYKNEMTTAYDLENIPEPKVGFVNVYEDTRGIDVGCTYRTLIEAKNVPNHRRCKGLLKLTLTEGKLEVEVA